MQRGLMQEKLHILSSTGRSNLKRHLPRAALALACIDTGQRSFWRYNSDTLDRWERSDRCARGASNELFDSELAFYTPRVGLLDADWLQRISCGALIGWSLQRVTSLRHAVAAKVLLLWKRFSRLATE